MTLTSDQRCSVLHATARIAALSSLIVLLAGCGGGGSGGGDTPPRIVSVTISPADPSPEAGTTVQLVATAAYTNDATENVTSSAVKAPISILGLSNGARAGLTGFIAGLSREVVRHNVTINNLLPGPFDTDRLMSNLRAIAERQGRPFEEVVAERKSGNPAGRLGDPDEFGQACAFLCGAHSGFITGQNLLLDGGDYPGTL